MKKLRMSLGSLRRLIRESLSGEDIAITIFGDQRNAYIVAYKISELESFLTTDKPGKNNCVVAGVWGSRQARLGPCYDAAVVKKSASSIKGWGTKVYLAALDFFGTMTSDRESVSDSAVGMWKSLVGKGLVSGEEFDDIEMPWTEPEEDDCKVHQKNFVLNSAYKLKSGLPSDVLDSLKKGRQHMGDLGNRGLVEKSNKILKDGFNSLFLAVYK